MHGQGISLGAGLYGRDRYIHSVPPSALQTTVFAAERLRDADGS